MTTNKDNVLLIPITDKFIKAKRALAKMKELDKEFMRFEKEFFEIVGTKGVYRVTEESQRFVCHEEALLGLCRDTILNKSLGTMYDPKFG